MASIIEKLRRRRRIKKKKRINRSIAGDIFLITLLILFGTFSAYPLVFSISNAFKPLNEIFIFPPKLIVENPTLDNFTDLINLMSRSWVPFTRYFFNTIFITLIGTVGHVIFASMAAYPLAKHNFPGKTLFMTLVVYSLMFAPQVVATPNYIIMSWIGLLDTYWAVILPAFAFPLGLFLMKQFMETIPKDLIESAKIDGASEFRILWQIVMPLVKPAWLTLVILLFQRLWTTDGGSFLYSEQLKPVSYALRQIVATGAASVGRQGTIAAITLIMMIVPITIFILSQSRVLETMTHSGMK
ncbi:carbohydrate ABC transporter permease [Haloplasma contractile]|uniref:Binding-protein-dependent transport systems inner membrane component n=1 Tax=Haloplasma contractile SSD-17B TaxID=1033810 RepID=F7PRD8_9MOLU|nr:carbohydrate ABC transporter permease [Haloplasma contractile]ERJ11736.1 Binding-protein-dependent transport systems inner membrane component [Haloplasma contractile SSD-17B]